MEQHSNEDETEIKQPVQATDCQVQSQQELLAKYIEHQKLRLCPGCGETGEIF